MHNIEYIREHPQDFDAALKQRNIAAQAANILKLDKENLEFKTKLQELQQRKNQIAKEIGKLKSQGKDATELMQEAESIKEQLAAANDFPTAVELQNILMKLPNILDGKVPYGASDADNIEIRKWGNIPEFSFKPASHFTIGEKLQLMDFETAAQISGSRFVIMKGALAKLERALANFMIDILTEKYGYEEISVPLLVNEQTLLGSGQLPKFAADLFKTTENKWLIPTGEVPLVNLMAQKITNSEQIPARFCAHTACFRSEAGAAGKDTRGMVRLHQFNKVEMVAFTTPEASEAEHERITNIAEDMLQQLNIPYRVMLLCSGDTGFHAAKTYDIEVWLPGENQYREISSCSNCHDFQARRMNAKFKDKDNNKQFLHSLNGSGLAVGRTLIAILENYQNQDGSITIPEALKPYMKQDIINK